MASKPPRACITSCDVLASSWWAGRRSPGRSPPGRGSTWQQRMQRCSVVLRSGERTDIAGPPPAAGERCRQQNLQQRLTLNHSDEPGHKNWSAETSRALGLCYYDPHSLTLHWTGVEGFGEVAGGFSSETTWKVEVVVVNLIKGGTPSGWEARQRPMQFTQRRRK